MDLRLEVGMLFVTKRDCRIWRVLERKNDRVVAINPTYSSNTTVVHFGDEVMELGKFLDLFDDWNFSTNGKNNQGLDN